MIFFLKKKYLFLINSNKVLIIKKKNDNYAHYKYNQKSNIKSVREKKSITSCFLDTQTL